MAVRSEHLLIFLLGRSVVACIRSHASYLKYPALSPGLALHNHKLTDTRNNTGHVWWEQLKPFALVSGWISLSLPWGCLCSFSVPVCSIHYEKITTQVASEMRARIGFEHFHSFSHMRKSIQHPFNSLNRTKTETLKDNCVFCHHNDGAARQHPGRSRSSVLSFLSLLSPLGYQWHSASVWSFPDTLLRLSSGYLHGERTNMAEAIQFRESQNKWNLLFQIFSQI